MVTGYHIYSICYSKGKAQCSIMHIADKEACDYSHVQALYSRQLPKVKLMLISCETKIKILCLDTLPSVEIRYS